MYRSMRVAACVVCVAAVAAGCGSEAPPVHAPTRATAPRPVVVLSRTVGTDPMVDEVVVGGDRRVEVRRLRGGAGARFDHFRLSGRELAGLRARLARLGRRGPTPDIELDRWYYTLRLAGRVPRYYVGGRVPGRARPVIRDLERLIDTSSQRDPTAHPR